MFENLLSSNQKTKSWCQQNTNRVGPIKTHPHYPSIHPSMLTNQKKSLCKYLLVLLPKCSLARAYECSSSKTLLINVCVCVCVCVCVLFTNLLCVALVCSSSSFITPLLFPMQGYNIISPTFRQIPTFLPSSCSLITWVVCNNDSANY